MSLHGHWWTIAPRIGPSRRRVHAGVPFEIACADPLRGRVILSGEVDEIPGAEAAILIVHGLAGCATSAYVLAAARAANAAGLTAMRLCLRGADRRGEDLYHAGLTADLHAALAGPLLDGCRRVYVLGFSLGGHVVLRFACESGDPRVRAVASVCAPLDLASCQRWLDRRRNWLYRRHLLIGLREIYAAVASRHAVPAPLQEVLRARTLRDFDDLTVAPRFGFRDAEDYYASVSVGPRLATLRLPTLLVAAREDPLVPASSLGPWLEGLPPHARAAWASSGGHVGFPRRLELGLGPELGGSGGLEAQVIAWLARQ